MALIPTKPMQSLSTKLRASAARYSEVRLCGGWVFKWFHGSFPWPELCVHCTKNNWSTPKLHQPMFINTSTQYHACKKKKKTSPVVCPQNPSGFLRVFKTVGLQLQRLILLFAAMSHSSVVLGRSAPSKTLSSFSLIPGPCARRVFLFRCLLEKGRETSLGSS